MKKENVIDDVNNDEIDILFEEQEDNNDQVEEDDKKHLIKNPVLREVFSYACVLVAAIFCAFIINHFILSNNVVPTGSMSPTIKVDTRLFGNRLAYKFGDPERGDIIVFKYPVDEEQLFIKRIIGLPNETVEIKDGSVYINGEVLDESEYLSTEMLGEFGPYQVPEDCYFVMGDNRNQSSDSRMWNYRAQENGLTVDEDHDYTYVPKENIISKALITYYPKIGVIK